MNDLKKLGKRMKEYPVIIVVTLAAILCMGCAGKEKTDQSPPVLETDYETSRQTETQTRSDMEEGSQKDPGIAEETTTGDVFDEPEAFGQIHLSLEKAVILRLEDRQRQISQTEGFLFLTGAGKIIQVDPASLEVLAEGTAPAEEDFFRWEDWAGIYVCDGGYVAAGNEARFADAELLFLSETFQIQNRVNFTELSGAEQPILDMAISEDGKKIAYCCVGTGLFLYDFTEETTTPLIAWGLLTKKEEMREDGLQTIFNCDFWEGDEKIIFTGERRKGSAEQGADNTYSTCGTIGTDGKGLVLTDESPYEWGDFQAFRDFAIIKEGDKEEDTEGMVFRYDETDGLSAFPREKGDTSRTISISDQGGMYLTANNSETEDKTLLRLYRSMDGRLVQEITFSLDEWAGFLKVEKENLSLAGNYVLEEAGRLVFLLRDMGEEGAKTYLASFQWPIP
ncbi:MAG: hypothetical protein HFI38_08925 [Lachnospiraceae bacterium]|jgi:hypothetical protein|nr:hypothetical protein [Lachnospiraceae bacterium]